MSDLYAALEDRLLAVVCDGRGADGSLGAEALAKSIPVARFRRAPDNQALRDPAVPAGAFDRAVRVDWLGETDDEGGNNTLSDPHFHVARVSVTNAVFYGAALSGAVATTGSEVGADVVKRAQTRALTDARRIRRALACGALLRDPSDTAAVPLGCFRDGETTLDDLGNGRLLVSSGFVFRYRLDNADDGDP